MSSTSRSPSVSPHSLHHSYDWPPAPKPIRRRPSSNNHHHHHRRRQRQQQQQQQKCPRFYSSPLSQHSADPQTPLQAYGLEQREPSIVEVKPRLLRRVSHVLDDIKEDFSLQLNPQGAAEKMCLRRRESAFFDGPPVLNTSPASPSFGSSSPSPVSGSASGSAFSSSSASGFGSGSISSPASGSGSVSAAGSGYSSYPPQPTAMPPPAIARVRLRPDTSGTTALPQVSTQINLERRSSLTRPLSIFSLDRVDWSSQPRRLSRRLSMLGSSFSRRTKRMGGSISQPNLIGSSVQM